MLIVLALASEMEMEFHVEMVIQHALDRMVLSVLEMDLPYSVHMLSFDLSISYRMVGDRSSFQQLRE